MEFPFDIPADGVIARVRASAGRRFFGCGTLLALGALLVLLGFTRAETGLGWSGCVGGCNDHVALDSHRG